MDLFYGRMSGNSARSLFALYEADAVFTPNLLDTHGGENRAAAYLALNPMGKIPALTDGTFRLWESNAINLYVAERYPASGLLPATIEGRAGVTVEILNPFKNIEVDPGKFDPAAINAAAPSAAVAVGLALRRPGDK